MKRTSGLTLIELLIVLAVSVVLIATVAMAYDSGIKFQLSVPEKDAQLKSIIRLENEIRTLLEGAYLTTDATDATSYFLTAASGGELAALDTLVFTTLGLRPTSAYLNSQDEFEQLNERFGPQGGLVEVAFSTVPVGETEIANGLFLRTQSPPDGDPTQGGMETALVQGIQLFQFEFFDGTQWLEEWSTFTGQRRLPAAIRITYQLNGDTAARTMTVRLPHSDVTPDNPLVIEVEQ